MVPPQTLTRFFINTLEAFFARQQPVSSIAKPACMNMTRAPQRQSLAESRAPPSPWSAFSNLAIFSSIEVSVWSRRSSFNSSIKWCCSATSAFNSLTAKSSFSKDWSPATFAKMLAKQNAQTFIVRSQREGTGNQQRSVRVSYLEPSEHGCKAEFLKHANIQRCWSDVHPMIVCNIKSNQSNKYSEVVQHPHKTKSCAAMSSQTSKNAVNCNSDMGL